ncbi:hypothetical protein PYCC9005_004877 [Savitreella phatthalungensis]
MARKHASQEDLQARSSARPLSSDQTDQSRGRSSGLDDDLASQRSDESLERHHHDWTDHSVTGSTQQPGDPDYKDMNLLQRWRYQYEVNFALYMITPEEKFVVNGVGVVILLLLAWCSYAYMPDHLRLMANRFYYYAHGRVESVARAGLSRASYATQKAKHAASATRAALQR